MAVLTMDRIKERLRSPISKPDSLIFTPLLQKKLAFDTDSLDMRLGTYFLLPPVPPEPFFYPGLRSKETAYLRVHIPLGNYLVVPAHQTVLGVTLEFIKLPFDVSGQILTKSSVARTFVVIETAPWIHPSYRGCLTLEIANVSNTPLLLYPGRLVSQLIFFEVVGAKAVPKQSGTYFGPVYPEAPVFRDPQQDLAMVGVNQTEFKRPEERLRPADRCPECLNKIVPPGGRCGFCESLNR